MTDTPDTAAPDAGGATDPAAVVEPWYCDQCGARYAGPGICENQHPPAELVELAPDAAAETGQDPAPVAELVPAASTDAPAADAGTADNTAAAADAAPTLAEQLPPSISLTSPVSTSIAGVPYSGTISVSLTKQQA